MNQNPFIDQAMEMVKAQAGVKQMTPSEMVEMTREIAEGLAKLAAGGEEHAETVQKPFIDPKKAIRLNYVICVECGARFKVLSKKHLESHALTPDEYREKWGYKKGTSLVCKSLTQQRREKMASTKIWEKAGKKGKAAEKKPESKPSADK
ncbi:MucR family transcriptional regulator [Oleidesulfovibrio alaskensis]